MTYIAPRLEKNTAVEERAHRYLTFVDMCMRQPPWDLTKEKALLWCDVIDARVRQMSRYRMYDLFRTAIPAKLKYLESFIEIIPHLDSALHRLAKLTRRLVLVANAQGRSLVEMAHEIERQKFTISRALVNKWECEIKSPVCILSGDYRMASTIVQIWLHTPRTSINRREILSELALLRTTF